MAESKVKRENYINIQGWMVADLRLKGNELLVYAIIYGFSQDGENRFTGSLSYLADWTNSTKQGVSNCLKSLVEKELIIKNDKVINGVKFCEYHATDLNGVLNKVVYPMQQSCTPPMQESCNNNIDLDNQSNNLSNKQGNKKDSFDKLIDAYLYPDGKSARFPNTSEIRELLGEWLKVRKAKRAAMTDKAIELNLKKLNRMAHDSRMSVPEYLREVICRGWQTFYAINNYQPQQRQQQGGNVFLDMAHDEGIF